MNPDQGATEYWKNRRRNTMRGLQRRLIAHVAAGRTTDLAAATLRNLAAVYTDSSRFAAEREQIFLQMPLVAGLSGDIPRAGDTLLFDGTGRPLIVVRGDDGKVRAFLNVCTHRGARLLAHGGCHEVFNCPFHGWSFARDGRLAAMPGAECFKDLDRGRLGLHEVPCAEWHGLIFVRAQPGEAIDVEAHLGSFAPELAEIGLAGFSPVKTATMKSGGNWKYVLETFGEGYHFASLHPDSLAQTHYTNVAVFDRFGRHHRICFAPKSYRQLAEQPEERWPELDSIVYLIFPNTTMLVGSPMPGHMFVQLFRICPTGVSATETLFTLYAPAEQLDGPGRAVAEGGFDLARGIIENEDFRMAALAQRNFETVPAGFAVHYGRNELALQHLHRDLAAAVGMPL